jgi:hypothetical protein
MSYNKDGLRYPTHIFEAALWRYSVRVDCSRCSHMAIFEAGSLWGYFEKRGWEDSRWSAPQRFFCLQCWKKQRGKVRPNRISYVKAQPTIQVGTIPSDLQVKKALSRYRA